jgi:acyl-coenzyme A thioesterase PaaI-like protein
VRRRDLAAHRRRRVLGVLLGGALAAAAAVALSLALRDSRDSRGAARFVVYPEAEVAGVKNPHNFRGRPLCQACHRAQGQLAHEPVRLCARCHSKLHRGHPVAVKQQGAPPRGVPLGGGGAVVCHSCHDPHLVTDRAALAAARKQGLDQRRLFALQHGLRMTVSELCVRCHPGH